jgi:hypothetical protein
VVGTPMFHSQIFEWGVTPQPKRSLQITVHPIPKY